MKKLLFTMSLTLIAFIGFTQGDIDADNVYSYGVVIADDSVMAGKKVITDTLKLTQEITWNIEDRTINIPTGSGSIIQAGREIQIDVYNNTGDTIFNGTAVYSEGATIDGVPYIKLAQSNIHENFGLDYGLTTVDIPTNSRGDVVWFGEAKNLNTSMYSVGDTIWISETIAGGLTNIRPSFPDYTAKIGLVMKVGVTDGIIFVTSRSSKDDTFNNFWNGVFRETYDFRITESGGIITGTLTPANGHANMTMLFSDGFTMLDTDPSATIELIAGTDANPQKNYVYIPQSTKELTISTTGFPTNEHIKVAEVLLQSATTTGINGALRNQNINDGIENTTTFQGHLSHITERLRQENAKWDNGIEGSSTIITASTPDDVWVSTTAGEVYQMHKQEFPALNTQTGDNIIIVNNPTSAYTSVTNLNTQLLDAGGNSLNSTSFSFVLWGVANKTGETSHLMINLPTDSYAFASPIDAVEDALNFSVYDIPKEFQGVGFLIARFTYTYKNDVWTLFDTENLRGKIPNVSAGGGGAGGGVTTFLGLDDTESSFTPYEFQVANAAGTALESPSDLVYTSTGLGIGTSNPQSALHIDKGTGVSSGISFGDGDSRIYELADDVLGVDIANDFILYFDSAEGIRGTGTGAGSLRTDNVSTSISPVHVFRGDENTGLGRADADQLSLIAGGVEGLRINDTEAHSVAGIANYETLVTDDDDIPNKKYVDDKLTINVVKAEVVYSDTTETTIITLPENAVVWAVSVHIISFFNDSGYDYLNLGYSTDPDSFYQNYDIGTTGANDYSMVTGITLTKDAPIVFKYTNENSDVTQGSAYVYVHYTKF